MCQQLAPPNSYATVRVNGFHAFWGELYPRRTFPYWYWTVTVSVWGKRVSGKILSHTGTISILPCNTALTLCTWIADYAANECCSCGKCNCQLAGFMAGNALPSSIAVSRQTYILFQNVVDKTLYSSSAFTAPEALIPRARAPLVQVI